MTIHKRVAVYLRVSTTDQKTDLQRAELLAYLGTRGWTQFTVYEEKLTGTNSNRPEFRRLMNDARAKNVDVVLCWKLDRFSRSLRDLIVHLQELADLGIEFISLKDQIDLSTSTGRLMLHIIGAFGQFEADIIKERVRAGLASAKAQGKRLGRPPEIDAETVLALRGEGLSLQSIASKLQISKTAVHNTLKRSNKTRG